MKTFIFSSALLLLSAMADAQFRMPQPSPTQTVKQDFGMGAIELNYSRPAAKGRKIMGDLVPYNKMWRTGANATTKITFTTPVEIGGKKIDTGSYAIYTIPGEKSWEVIFNKGFKNQSVLDYKEAEDVARVTVKTEKLKDKMGSFTMQLEDVLPESCNLVLAWEETKVSVPIKTDVKTPLRANLETALQSEKKPHWAAAQFYNEYDNNKAKALEHVSSALNENPKAFWMWLYKARIQKDMGDKAGAMESSKKSLELATEQKNDDYIKMNRELQASLK